MSIEDGLAEDDWDNWPEAPLQRLAGRTLVLGDDLLCTHPQRIARAVNEQSLQCPVAESKPDRHAQRSPATGLSAGTCAAGWHVVIVRPQRRDGGQLVF